jgi:hypothetical protein
MVFSKKLEFTRFQKAEIACPVEDDVVEQIDPNDHPCRLELCRDVHIALRWIETAAGVIVGDDDC